MILETWIIFCIFVVLIEVNVMNNLNKLPGMDLVSETLQGSFYVDTVSDPNPGFYNRDG